MAIKFDYTATDTPDEVIRSVAAEMSGGGLKPLSDDERLERQIWREERAWRHEQERIEREQQRDRQQAEQESAARHEAALALAENNKRLRLELQERQRERDREQQLVGLHIRAKQQDVWQFNVEAAARIAVHQRQQRTLMGELENMLSPPALPPEPERQTYVSEDEMGSPNLGDRDFNVKAWMKKPRPWW